MNRAIIIALIVLVGVLSSAATVLIVSSTDTGKPGLTEEQRASRAKLFGSDKELPPIKEGQEMRPRW